MDRRPLAAAARQQAERRWQGCDDAGDPAIHGMPVKRLRNRTGLARSVLDRRIQLRLSHEVVAAECGVVHGEVQAREAGTRIPTSAEFDALARVLDLDRGALAGAEPGSAVYRNELSAEQQAELDALYCESDTKLPDLASRFGLEGRSIHKLVTPLPRRREMGGLRRGDGLRHPRPTPQPVRRLPNLSASEVPRRHPSVCPHLQAGTSMTAIPSADTCQAPSWRPGSPLYPIDKAATTPP
jgi:transcriptional regulator with XRE-family HTH domain